VGAGSHNPTRQGSIAPFSDHFKSTQLYPTPLAKSELNPNVPNTRNKSINQNDGT
jgi:hypothetical protein